MKVAQALTDRAALQTQLNDLRSRLDVSVTHQEGDSPTEDPAALMAEADRVVKALMTLIQRINRTNASASFPTGGTVTDAIAKRDALGMQHSTLDRAVRAVGDQRSSRGMRTELRTIVAIDMPAVRQQMDEIAKERRALDSTLQELNWKVDLVD